MNALSPIRQFAASDIRPVSWPKGATALSGAPAIPLSELQQLSSGAFTQSLGGTQPTQTSFANVIGQLVNEVGDKQAAAGENVSALLGGQNVSLHQAMISMEEASVSFQIMVEVRNKLLESYQELMRMQI
jgi:flagellar hook-basal body complex protein FliE